MICNQPNVSTSPRLASLSSAKGEATPISTPLSLTSFLGTPISVHSISQSATTGSQMKVPVSHPPIAGAEISLYNQTDSQSNVRDEAGVKGFVRRVS